MVRTTLIFRLYFVLEMGAIVMEHTGYCELLGGYAR